MEEKGFLDTRIEQNKSNLETFIENINSLYDTFQYSELMLRAQRLQVARDFEAFLKKYPQNEVDGAEEINLPESQYRELTRLIKRQERSKAAFDLIPKSYIVSLVSLYDVFVGGLIKNIFAICPEILINSDQKISYSELSSFNSIDEIKENIIDAKIESILRDSHHDQISWFERILNVQTLKKFDNWSKFVEITQRRNLFVHANGIVSTQYLQICRNSNVTDIDKIKKNDKLEVTREYFQMAFEVLYEVSVKLSQMVLRCLLIKKDKNLRDQVDKAMIAVIFDLIDEERYNLALELSKFALLEKFKHSDIDRIYLVLNMAQAYKWKGENEECTKLLKNEDSSAWKSELQLAKAVLLDLFDDSIALMHQIGSDSEIFNKTEYRTWPIFKMMRERDDFKRAFKEIFQENLEVDNQKICGLSQMDNLKEHKIDTNEKLSSENEGNS